MLFNALQKPGPFFLGMAISCLKQNYCDLKGPWHRVFTSSIRSSLQFSPRPPRGGIKMHSLRICSFPPSRACFSGSLQNQDQIKSLPRAQGPEVRLPGHVALHDTMQVSSLSQPCAPRNHSFPSMTALLQKDITSCQLTSPWLQAS